ncbi:hypothetical protein F5883DRAFT_577754 [Diaporthe sp. PMI_573]|nr:hypothetical protein F5883DRAFT_268766 [Diaporthaceae sp. PMI_573]KAH8751663.1 hypothetical protein F5883DRAFT_577754 [Diaporthaceae sp. PMI_573]
MRQTLLRYTHICLPPLALTPLEPHAPLSRLPLSPEEPRPRVSLSSAPSLLLPSRLGAAVLARPTALLPIRLHLPLPAQPEDNGNEKISRRQGQKHQQQANYLPKNTNTLTTTTTTTTPRRLVCHLLRRCRRLPLLLRPHALPPSSVSPAALAPLPPPAPPSSSPFLLFFGLFFSSPKPPTTCQTAAAAGPPSGPPPIFPRNPAFLLFFSTKPTPPTTCHWRPLRPSFFTPHSSFLSRLFSATNVANYLPNGGAGGAGGLPVSGDSSILLPSGTTRETLPVSLRNNSFRLPKTIT